MLYSIVPPPYCYFAFSLWSLLKLMMMEKLNHFSNAEIFQLGSKGYACKCPVSAFQNVNNPAFE